MDYFNKPSSVPEPVPEQPGAQNTFQNTAQDTTQDSTQNTMQNTFQNTFQNTELPTKQYQWENTEPPKKKLNGKAIVAIVVAVILIFGGGTAFAFRGAIANTLSLATKSPAEYYAFLEKQEIKKFSDKYSAYMNMYKKGISCNMTSDLTYDRDTVNALLQSSAQLSLDDIEKKLGIAVDSIGFDGQIISKDGSFYEDLGLRLNKVDLINAIISYDAAKQQFLFHLPDLSPAYVSMTPSSLEGIDSDDVSNSYVAMNAISSAIDTEFLTRYANLIVDKIDNVKLKKNVEIKAKTLSMTCNQLTVTIDDKQVNKIALAILNEAKNDKSIISLLPSLNIKKEDFLSSIEDATKKIQEEITDDGRNVLKMNVYTADNGTILGRQFVYEEDGVSKGSLGYTFVEKAGKIEFDFNVKDALNNALAQCYGTCTKKGKAYSGKATVEIPAAASLGASLSLNLDFENVYSKIINDRYYQYGKFTLSAPMLMGSEITLNYGVKDNEQSANFTVKMGGTKLVGLDSKLTYSDDTTIPALKGNEKIIDISKSDFEDYEKTIDYKGFVSELSKKLGVDMKKIIGSKD